MLSKKSISMVFATAGRRRVRAPSTDRSDERIRGKIHGTTTRIAAGHARCRFVRISERPSQIAIHCGLE
jgi:hypothetical protein